MSDQTSSPAPIQAQRNNEHSNGSESNGSVYPPLAQFVANIRVAVQSNQKTNVNFNIRQTVIGEHFSRLTVTGQFACLEGSEQAAIISLTSAIDLDCFTVDGNPWVVAGRDDIKHASGWGLVSSWRGLRGLQKRNLIRLLSQDFGANGRNKWELLPPLPVAGFEPRCTFWKWRCTTSARQPLSDIELAEIEKAKAALILETARAGEAPKVDELNAARAQRTAENAEKIQARAGETGLLPNTTAEARAGETGLLPNEISIGPSPVVSNDNSGENAAVSPARAMESGTKNALNSTTTTTTTNSSSGGEEGEESKPLLAKMLDELCIDEPVKSQLLELPTTTRRKILAAKLCLGGKSAKDWVGMSVNRIRGFDKNGKKIVIDQSMFEEADDLISGKTSATPAKLNVPTPVPVAREEDEAAMRARSPGIIHKNDVAYLKALPNEQVERAREAVLASVASNPNLSGWPRRLWSEIPDMCGRMRRWVEGEQGGGK